MAASIRAGNDAQHRARVLTGACRTGAGDAATARACRLRLAAVARGCRPLLLVVEQGRHRSASRPSICDRRTEPTMKLRSIACVSVVLLSVGPGAAQAQS